MDAPLHWIVRTAVEQTASSLTEVEVFPCTYGAMSSQLARLVFLLQIALYDA